MAFWLVKTEPNVYSIDDLARDKITPWDGVRNYQARNYLNDMAIGDQVLVYHSNEEPVGVVGVAKVTKKAYPDPTQFDRSSQYFDPKASKDVPRWFSPNLKFDKKFKRVLPLSELRKESKLKDMVLLQRGSRLSVIPLKNVEFKHIINIAE